MKGLRTRQISILKKTYGNQSGKSFYLKREIIGEQIK
jgi:hypothetical protein